MTLSDVVEQCPWLMDLLAAVREVEPPECWIGAGAVRDVVWDTLFGSGFDPARVRDVDVVYFDLADMRRQREAALEQRLRALRPGVSWDVKNQAAVHLWYRDRFGVEVAALTSLADAVATWPETAACVAIRWGAAGLEILAPFGVDDLMTGVWRGNPVRVTPTEAARRLAAKAPAQRWPRVRVV